MLAFFSQTFFRCLNFHLPSEDRGRLVRHPGKAAARAEHCPKEWNRWIARWENEGGALGPEEIASNPKQ